MTRLLALSLVLLPFAACTAGNGDEGLYLSRILAVGDTCSFTPDDNAPYLSSGSYSVGAPVSYQANVLLQSRLTLNEGQEVQARTVQMRGARVTLAFTNPDDNPGIAEEFLRFTSLFSAPVAPGGNATGGFDLVPYQVSMALEETFDGDPIQMVATVEAFGTMAGDEVVTQEFVFPLTITDLRNVLGTCPLPIGTPVRTGNACNPFQDGVVDCCSEAGGLVCPATVATTEL